MVPGGGNGLLAPERVSEYRGEYIAKFDVNVSRNGTRYIGESDGRLGWDR
jgi:hypothetical protein